MFWKQSLWCWDEWFSAISLRIWSRFITKVSRIEQFDDQNEILQLRIGRGNLQISLCTGIANQPAKAIPNESDIEAIPKATCRFSHGTLKNKHIMNDFSVTSIFYKVIIIYFYFIFKMIKILCKISC